MAPDKSLAAEIEARAVKAQSGLARAYELIADQYGTWSPEAGTQFSDRGAAEAVEGIRLARELLAEIAAFQSRAFEDGARSMRERAKLACLDYGEACLDRSIKLLHEHDLPRTGDAIGWADAATGCARLVEALPLQPEGERNA